MEEPDGGSRYENRHRERQLWPDAPDEEGHEHEHRGRRQNARDEKSGARGAQGGHARARDVEPKRLGGGADRNGEDLETAEEDEAQATHGLDDGIGRDA
jgi:hypothetical protein